MPCMLHPNTLRFLSPEMGIFCPECSNIKEITTNEKALFLKNLNDRITALESSIHNEFSSLILELGLDELITWLVYERESVAGQVLREPESGDYTSWIALSYLISCSFSKISDNNSESDILGSIIKPMTDEVSYSFRNKLKNLIDSTKILFTSFNDYTLLKSNKAAVFSLNGALQVVKNESCQLDFTPEPVLEEIYRKRDTIKNPIVKDVHTEFESLMKNANTISGRFTDDLHELYYSDLILKKLRRIFPKRMFPNLKLKPATELENFLDGLLLTDSSSEERSRVVKIVNTSESPPSTVSISRQQTSITIRDYKPSILLKTDRNELIVPLITARMFQICLWRFVKRQHLSKIGNVSGAKNEQHIYDNLHMFDLQFNHPKTGEILIGYEPDIYNSKEIADVIAYNDEYLFIIESKHWHSAKLTSLEEEFEKFLPKIDFFKKNIDKLGFNKNLQVIPFIVTPNAPYAEYKGISIVRSGFEAQMLVGTYAEDMSKPVPLSLDETLRLTAFNIPANYRAFSPVSVDGRTKKLIEGYPDLKKLGENLYRIHDVLFEKCDKTSNEIVVKMIPFSDVLSNDNLLTQRNLYPLTFDMTGEMTKKVSKKKPFKGDLVRVIVKNLNGGWNQVQVIDFHILERVNYRDPVLEKMIARDRAPTLEIGQKVLGRLMTDDEYFICKCHRCKATFSIVTLAGQLGTLINEKKKGLIPCSHCGVKYRLRIDNVALKFESFDVVSEKSTIPAKTKPANGEKKTYLSCIRNPEHKFPLNSKRTKKMRCFCGGKLIVK
ncbi:MAG: hypothetical protein ACFFD4_32325 [Candidatus Odinarchaeota archaeon]